MALTITKLKDIPPPATNKGGGEEFAIKCKTKLDTCYEYERGVDSKGYVLNPKIDFMIVTLKVKDRETRKSIATHISQMLIDSDEPQYEPYYVSHLPKKAKNNFHGYTHSLRIADLPGLAAIQFKPKHKSYNDLKITIIPSQWTYEHVKQFWDTIFAVSNGNIDADYIIQHGKITRLDWAIDFLNVDTSDFLIEKNTENPRKNVTYFGPNGGVETSYIGPNSQKISSQNFKAYIYDKRAKSKEKQEKPIYDDLLHMRLEIRLLKQSLTDMTLKSFYKLSGKAANRFKPYLLTDFFAVPNIASETQWHMFGDCCKVRGIDTALGMLLPETKYIYMKHMEDARVVCWKPDLLWNAVTMHTKFILGKLKVISI
ncbi:MAG: hypothetical protein R3D86_08565 [Emcibacteraceae bacterium]